MLIYAAGPSAPSPTFALAGKIHEDCEAVLDKLAGELASKGNFSLDLKGIESINSFGAMLWSKFLAKVPASAQYTYVNAPMVFVNYCNLLEVMRGRGTFVSIEVPYECDECGFRDIQPLAIASLKADFSIKKRDCPECQAKGTLTSEIDPEEDLVFLQ